MESISFDASNPSLRQLTISIMHLWWYRKSPWSSFICLCATTIMGLLTVITDSQQQKFSSEGSSLKLLIGAASSRLSKPWPGSQVRIRCSSMHQVSFFHLVRVFNSLQEVCLLKDFMFIKYPSPNLIIPEVFRCADHRRRKYWSFLLSKLVNFLYESGRINLDRE